MVLTRRVQAGAAVALGAGSTSVEQATWTTLARALEDKHVSTLGPGSELKEATQTLAKQQAGCYQGEPQ